MSTGVRSCSLSFMGWYPAPKEEQFQGAPWLTKPVMPEDLLSAIDKAMGNREPA